MPERFFTTYQVADLLGATPGAVVEWIQKGDLPVQRLPDGPLRVSEKGLVEFLKGRGEDPKTVFAKASLRKQAKVTVKSADAGMPQLDPAADDSAVMATPQVRPDEKRSQSIEQMFPLDLADQEDSLGPDEVAALLDEEQSEGGAEQADQAEAAPLPQEAAAPTMVQPVEPPREQVQAPRAPTAPQPAAESSPLTEAPDLATGEPAGGAMALLGEAVARGATQVLLESRQSGLLVRLRIDGVLHEAAKCGVELPGAGVVGQIDSLVGVTCDQAAGPAVGRVEVRIEGRSVGVEVASCPTSHGRRIVVRLRDSHAMPLDLLQLELSEESELLFGRMLARPNGLVILAKRPGRDRDTALAAITSAMDASASSIVVVTPRGVPTVAGLTAIAAPTSGLSCADAVRTAFEQEADAVILEEVPDAATAVAAVQAAEAGRGIVACVNAPGVVEAIEELLEMGVQQEALAAGLRAAVSHVRLRRLCPRCRRPAPVSGDELSAVGLEGGGLDEAFVPVGCERCWNTGYLGTAGCTSLWLADKTTASMLRTRSPDAELRQQARRGGMRSLGEIGLEMVADGTTSLEELLRVLPV